MNLPNLLTLVRLVLSPLFLVCYVYAENLGIPKQVLPYILLAIFVISEMSDALDGYLARKLGQVTELGKLFDPMADSIARTSAFLTFTVPPVSLPIVIVFLLIYRDSVIGTLRTVCALKGFTLAARTSGKIKAVIQAIAIFGIILLMIAEGSGAISLEGLHHTSLALAGIAVLYTILSGVEYILANRRFIW